MGGCVEGGMRSHRESAFFLIQTKRKIERIKVKSV